jgi:hypothetical protein
VPTWFWSAVAGVGLGLLYAASPLLVITLAGAAALLALAGRDLPAAERRRIAIIIGAALGVRLLFIAALLVSNIPHLSDLGVGGLRGDDAYYLAGRFERATSCLISRADGMTFSSYQTSTAAPAISSC